MEDKSACHIKKYGTEKKKSYIPIPTYQKNRKASHQKNTITTFGKYNGELAENTHAESTPNFIHSTAGNCVVYDLESECTNSGIDFGVRPSDTNVDNEELAPAAPTMNVLTTSNFNEKGNH